MKLVGLCNGQMWEVREGAVSQMTSECLASMPTWPVLVSPFTRGGLSFGRNDLGFDFEHVMVSLKHPGVYFVLSNCEGRHLPPHGFLL